MPMEVARACQLEIDERTRPTKPYYFLSARASLQPDARNARSCERRNPAPDANKTSSFLLNVSLTRPLPCNKLDEIIKVESLAAGEEAREYDSQFQVLKQRRMNRVNFIFKSLNSFLSFFQDPLMHFFTIRYKIRRILLKNLTL